MSSGGEGEIHAVVSKPSRFSSICVKIYFKAKRTKQLEKKLKYMVANPPHQITSASSMIGWPLDVIYDGQKNFIGFVMPLAFSNSEPLIVLTAKNLSKKLNPVWADKFDRRLGAMSMVARLKLICNIAIPIHLLHSTNKYVLRDFKPENVLITYDGKVTLVDMDSVQITEESNLLLPKMLFPASTLGTPGYMPPEHYTRNVGKSIDTPIVKSWDYFSIGVVFYQVIFGLHPYVVTPIIARDANSNEIFQNIAQNLFPFGSNSAKVSSYPPPHNNFKRIPVELQTLFRNAFSDNTNVRPSLELWVKTIKEALKKAPPPVQTFGTIVVHSSPSPASVKMDNAYIGMTPISFKANAGFHRIDLSYNGISQTYNNVEVKVGGTTTINAQLASSSSSSNDRNNDNSNSTSGNSGCLWAVLIAVICGIGILVGVNANTNSRNYTPVEEVAEVDSIVEVVEVVDEVAENYATYLNVSDDNIYFDADGGYREITINTDGDWEISIGTAEWGHLTQNGNSLLLHVDEYTGSSERTDYFIVKADNYEKRINITQRPDNTPMAEIERIWVDHNVYEDGSKGMRIHVKFTNRNLKGRRISVYAYFYQEDNITELHDPYGNSLSCHDSSTPKYDNSTYEDFDIFIPHSALNMSPGTQGTFSFDISIKDDSGNQLTRENNTQFNFSNI